MTQLRHPMSIELTGKRSHGALWFTLGILGWTAGMTAAAVYYQQIIMFVLVVLLGRDMPVLEMLFLIWLKIPLLAFLGVVSFYAVAQLREVRLSSHPPS